MLKRLRAYAYAAASEAIIALCAFGLLFVLGARYDAATVSAYLLIRRVVAVLVPAVTLGMPQALVRHLVLCARGGSRPVAASLLVVLVGLAVLAAAAGIAGGPFTELVLGVAGYQRYAWPIVITALGIALTTIAAGTLRARERISAATSVMIANLGVIPLLMALALPELWQFLVVAGAFQVLVSAAVLVRDVLAPWPQEAVPVRAFLAFGARTITADFALMVLLWLPPATVARAESLVVSGYLSLILSLAMLLASPIAPVAMSLMPRVSAAVARRDGTALRRFVLTIAGVALAWGASMVLCGGMLYAVVARLVLGEGNPLEPGAVWALLSVIVPMAVVFGLRNAIDVVWSPLHNTAILATGIGAFLAVSAGVERIALQPTRIGVTAGFASAAWLMAALAAVYGLRMVRKWRVSGG